MNSAVYKLVEACRAPGCPVCQLEQQALERYLENHFYENVNSPAWRDRLRDSLGFCNEHTWLAANKRLGDALGFSILYRDLLNSVLKQLEDGGPPARTPRGWSSFLGRIPEQTRQLVANLLTALTPRKPCPVCEYQDEILPDILRTLVEGLEMQELVSALQASEGVCVPHLRQALEHMRKPASCETLLNLHRERLEGLRAELDEFIRKNDYQFTGEGFGREGDAWLRAIALVVGSRKDNILNR